MGLRPSRTRKRSKFGVYLDEDGIEARTFRGKVYDSVLECNYARELDLRLRARDIIRVREQVPIRLHGRSGKLVATYYADFEVTYPDGRVEYIDTKGLETAMFRLKLRWLRMDYPQLTLRCVRKA